jgi:hypothetical protein
VASMIYRRLKRSVHDIIYGAMARREVTVFPDDLFVVSYPKSGNTWVRFLVANLMYPDSPATFSNIGTLVPDIYKNKDEDLKALRHPRVLKSHEYFDPRYPRVVCVVRDPRDVAVSYYHHLIKKRVLREDVLMEQYIPRFISGAFDNFKPWNENVESWLRARAEGKDILLVRYEDLRSDTAERLKQIGAFAKCPTSAVQIAQAIERSSFNTMRDLERRQGAQWVTSARSRTDIAFVRSGSVGGWRNAPGAESMAAIEGRWGATMRRLGYA